MTSGSLGTQALLPPHMSLVCHLSMEQAEADHSSASQEISHLAWNLTVPYHFTYNSNKVHVQLTKYNYIIICRLTVLRVSALVTHLEADSDGKECV
jgi:hypothetical protein